MKTIIFPSDNIIQFKTDTGGAKIALNFADAEMIIMSLSTFSHFQGCGHATKMLQYLINLAQKFKLKAINLDDMSDHYRRPTPENIYLKNGWQYLSNDGPEMRRPI